jgi:hypothetical protein
MEFSTLSVKRTKNSPDFWDERVPQIVVVVASISYKLTDCLLAYGVDPNHLDAFVFVRLLPAPALGEFFKALLDGDADDPELDDYWVPWTEAVEVVGAPVEANSVDVVTPVPTPTGPKAQVVFAYAAALNQVEALAELGQTETIVITARKPLRLESVAP